MKKSTLLTWTIIFTILSLIYILLTYFGILRYWGLHRNSPENYIQGYSKLPRASKKRVVLTFTTTPDRIGRMEPMINSILDQTVKVNQILLVTPYRSKGRSYDIPKYVTDVVNVVPAARDYGEGTNLVPVLLREKECDTIILALRDDVVYGKDFVETMVDAAEKHPKSVLVDNKGYAMLVRPECFDAGVVDREKEEYDKNWFLGRARDSEVVEYGENRVRM